MMGWSPLAGLPADQQSQLLGGPMPMAPAPNPSVDVDAARMYAEGVRRALIPLLKPAAPNTTPLDKSRRKIPVKVLNKQGQEIIRWVPAE